MPRVRSLKSPLAQPVVVTVGLHYEDGQLVLTPSPSSGEKLAAFFGPIDHAREVTQSPWHGYAIERGATGAWYVGLGSASWDYDSYGCDPCG